MSSATKWILGVLFTVTTVAAGATLVVLQENHSGSASLPFFVASSQKENTNTAAGINAPSDSATEITPAQPQTSTTTVVATSTQTTPTTQTSTTPKSTIVTGTPTIKPPTPITPTVKPVTPTATTYTTAQVATHSSTSNCWLIISGKIYNVSPFINPNSHPGGVASITPYCGKDATTAFKTHGHGTSGTDHSAYAYSLLPNYYVSTVTGAVIANTPPTANAGIDKTITLPTSSVTLTGTGTDIGGSVASYKWTKISGTGGTITSSTSATTTVTGLVQGIYTFRLTVTDNKGGTGTDDVLVTVINTLQVNVAPTANAGANKTITLPANSVTLSGSGSDSDGTIASYAWSKISGGTATIASATSASTSVTGLVQGSYTFQLMVKDNQGASDTATVDVTVNGAAVGSYTPAQVATHSSPSNCWLTISNKAYNVTSFITPVDNHPGMASAITPYCGKDATIAFKTHGTVGGSDHSAYAYSMLPAYYVGTVSGVIPNVSPVADAGLNQDITLPTNSVTLDGSGSDTDGSVVSYTWSKTSGGAATIVSPTSRSTNVTGLVAGTYIFKLTVKDDKNATGTSTVTITVSPAVVDVTPPTFSAITAGAIATISATITWTTDEVSNSQVEYGTTTAYGSSTAVSSASAIDHSVDLTNLAVGTLYHYRVKSKDAANNLGTSSDNIFTTTNIVNGTPTANAGTDQSITLPTSSITLTGTGSDSDGSITSYAWTKTSGGAATITSATSPSTTVTGLAQGTYVFTLTVTDNQGATGTDTITVTVNGQVVNAAPTANAGTNQTITLPTNSVTLTGIGSDSDGTIASYAWSKVTGGAATITSATAATTTVTGLVQDTYTFQLLVTDNQGATGVDSITITVNGSAPVNVPPTANAGADQSITLPTSNLTLSGTGADSDGSIASYAWTKVTGTGGTITSANSASTSVTGLTQGSYTFRLTVTDNQGATGTDTMIVTVNPAPANISPTANAGSNQNITLPTNSVTLTGTGSDSDGSIASYAWTKTSGGAATITSATSATTTVTGLVQGSYTFLLTVTDNQGATGTSSMTVTVAAANNPPTANAGADQSITLPTSSVTLSGSGTDVGGTIASYSWSKTSGGAATIASPNSASTSVTGLVQGSYTFTLTVTDNQGATATDAMNVTVNPAAVTGYTAAQVATHNSSSNCWVIVTMSSLSKVYNITAFLPNHPPGASYITSKYGNLCGTDITSPFVNGSPGGHNHSNSAKNTLATYFVGNLIP